MLETQETARMEIHPLQVVLSRQGVGVMELHQAQAWEGEMVEDSRRLHLYTAIMQIAN